MQQAICDVQVLVTPGHLLEYSNFWFCGKSEAGIKKAGRLKPAYPSFSR